MQYLGRAKDVGEFVKHGSREATIEVELQRHVSGPNATRRNPVITRVIKRDGNKSTWTLNGHQSSARAVQTFAQGYDIQIDNLCQFLPQDKVVEFAQMSPTEILESTQRAVAARGMIERHENLKELRIKQKELLTENKGNREHLQNLENRQDMQRTEVERMRERAAVKKRLDWLERCRPIPQYADAKRRADEAKARAKELSAELRSLKDESGPALGKVNAKQQYERQVRELKDQCKKNVATNERNCDRIEKDIEAKETAMKDLDTNFEAEKKSIAPKREEMKRTQQRIAVLKHQKAQQPEDFDSRAINQEIQDLTERRRELDDRASDVKARKDPLARQGNERKQQIINMEGRLKALETETGKQETKLEHASRDTLKAWKWIQDNRDKFQQHVYGPPLVECSLKDARMANAVECLLQANDFKIITVQNQADFDFLQRKIFRELKLHDVSLRTCSLDNLNHFSPPLSAEAMRQAGLESWALDHLRGPPTVLAMLCIEKHLHQCGITSRDVSQRQHDDLANSKVWSYVAGNRCYRFVRRAEYGAAGISAQMGVVRPAQAWTNQGVDMGRKAALEREIAEKKGELSLIWTEFENLKAELVQIADDEAPLEKEVERLKQDKEAKQRALMEWKALDTKIQGAEEKVKSLYDFIGEARSRMAEIIQQKDGLLLEKAELVMKFAAAANALKESMASLVEAEVMYIEALSDYETLKARNEHIVDLLKQKHAEEQDATAMSQEALGRARQLMKAVHALRQEGLRLEEEEGDHGLTDLLLSLSEKKILEEDLDAEIDAEKAKLELTEGGSAHIIQEFEEREKLIEKLRARLQDFNQKQGDLKHEIAEARGEWEPQLDALVAKISDAFSDSFARIGCAGQVAVFKASSDDPADCTEENGGRENGLDFANWAIHISVKFRESEPLTLLNSHRQSGGERAVSTIFYLMALQSLSRAPFRVVDEINQGMDPRNERMVHGRMVDIAADEGGSQYFLITPKLLSGLKYRRGMTVLCIVSGENMPAARTKNADGTWLDGPKIDFRAFAQKTRELGYVKDGGRRIDSGVGLGVVLAG